MPYFERFKNVKVDFTTKTDLVQIQDVITDLTTRIQTKISESDLDKLCFLYSIQDHETPESIAHKVYGDPHLNWVILYINNIVNMYEMWPLSEVELEAYCQRIYGSSINSTRYSMKSPENVIMDRDMIEQIYGSAFAVDVTNWEHEVSINEKKRIIRIVNPQYVGAFIDNFYGKLIT